MRGRRHWQRYREIAQVLLRHGFDQLVDLLELAPFAAFPARWLRRRRDEEWTAPQRLRHALEELGPTFIKLGQILSARPDLVPPDFLAELTKLQDSAPPFPATAARAIIAQELGTPLESVFSTFDDTPIAAASLGQVHRATLRSGERVVVKVQRPNIAQIINTDLEILLDLAGFAQNRLPLGALYNFPEIVEDFAATLYNELDYEREGRNAERFHSNFAHDEAVYIPRVYREFTTRRVLVLEEIQGIKISDIAALDAAGIDRRQVALESARLLILQVFRDRFFHADPHPGNFYVLSPASPDGRPRIGAMDFGMVGEIDDRTREHLLRLLVAIVRRDVERVVDEFLSMGVVEWGQFDRRRLERDLGRFLNRYVGQPVKTWRIRDMVSEATPIAFRHRLRFPSELWLLAKVLTMAEGIAQRLDPDFDLIGVAEPYARELYRDMVTPRALGQRAIEGLGELGEELLLLPRQLRRLRERLEQGALPVIVRQEWDNTRLERWDRMASRLAASILIAAFIIAVSLLVPLLGSDIWRILAAGLIVLGFINATLLTIWLLYTTWPRR